MASENHKKAQSREEMRFEREAKALQKNLEKTQASAEKTRGTQKIAERINKRKIRTNL